ncbi:hypothetical protein [Pseudanabaena sp. FACHB-2040]|uniref:hypothetical protein n=1 Tax=Pseudanabaena sp. FACHB-2040 TaxID=2692859 RepID=UPI0019C7BA76|nr:hypothetical protein [Pseudanabaena sp. FACHB-2040]MBD0266864.1 hypothetical protein [Cyanobacteria bacterium Co-bin8]MBD2260411.1 hypothetical protein [Pseudanabaena sp. FACHB-2040]
MRLFRKRQDNSQIDTNASALMLASTASSERDLSMTTTNGTSNADSDTPEQPEAKTTSRSKRQSAKNSGLVKARAEDDVIVLANNVRLIPTEYLPNHRPIQVSDFEIVATLDSAGQRPIMANTFEIANTDVLPGHRPIEVSHFPTDDLHMLLGNRPISPNDVVDPPSFLLMGYLD